jgi:MFS family permease
VHLTHDEPIAALRRARAAATVAFLLTGAVFASWAARIPAVQERLALSPGGLSVALVGMEAGAVAGLTAGARLAAARGSRWSLRIGFAVYPPALVAVAAAPDLALLGAALVVMGAANSVIDVAINVQGVELERRYGRPLLSGLHGAHSFGVLGGGLAGTVLASYEVEPLVHFAGVAALAVAASQAAGPLLVTERPVPARARPAAPRGVRLPERALAQLGLLAFAAFFVEGAANDWSAVHLRAVHDASPAFAAAAFTAFSLTLALGRVLGDRLAARQGRAALTRAAAVAAACGAVVVVAAPSATVALVGWSLLGAGMAPIAPALLGAAPQAGTAAPPAAIATVSMIGYAGSFAGPPIIGAVAELSSLTAALVLLVAGTLAIALGARRALASSHPQPRRPVQRAIAPASRQYYDPTQRTTGP